MKTKRSRGSADLAPVGLFVCLGFVFLFLILHTAGRDAERKQLEQDRKEFAAWVRVTGRQDVKFEDWQQLKRAGALPAITPKP